MKHAAWLVVLGSMFVLSACEENPPPVKPRGRPPVRVQTPPVKPSTTGTASAVPTTKAISDTFPALLDPKHADVNKQAPEEFKVRFETTKGDFVVKVTREWAPNGADRFYNLVSNGFYNECKFFRVIKGFMVQFGINGDPKVSSVWKAAMMKDDPRKQSNTRGMLTYAMAGPNTRTSQLFINFDDNSRLDPQGFSPFGEVIEGMDIVDALYNGYGEGAPRGAGPDQGRVQSEGNVYLNSDFPELDSIKAAKILE